MRHVEFVMYVNIEPPKKACPGDPSMPIANMNQETMPRGPLNVGQRRDVDEKGPKTRLPVGYCSEWAVSPNNALSNGAGPTSFIINNPGDTFFF